MELYDDWGYGQINKNYPDLTWIENLEVYPKTPVYRNQYKCFSEIAQRLNIKVNKYLSLGSGLGRHIIISREVFPEITHITSVDSKIKPHKTLSQLKGLDHIHLTTTVKYAIRELESKHQKFDFIVFENIGHQHEISTFNEIKSLSNLLTQTGLIAFIGDTKFDTSLLLGTELFKRIPNITEDWGDTTKYNLWMLDSLK